MKAYLCGGLSLMAVLFLTAGCSSSGNSGTTAPPVVAQTATIKGAVVDAFVDNATVTAYPVSAAGVVGTQCIPAPSGGCTTATTDANGNYSITVSGYSGAVMLEATGGTYTDTVTGQTVAIPSTLTLSVLEPNVTAGSTYTDQLTGLTTMAANLALGSMAAPQNQSATAALAAATALVESSFGVQDLSSTGLLNLSSANCGSASGISQANFDASLVLAGIAQLAQQYGVTSAQLTQALIADYSSNSGFLSGLFAGGTSITVGGAAIPLSTIEGTNFGQSLYAAIQTYVASAANACKAASSTTLQTALQTQSANVAQKCTSAYYCYETTVNYSGPAGVTLSLVVSPGCSDDVSSGSTPFQGSISVGSGSASLSNQSVLLAATAAEPGSYIGPINYDYLNDCGTNKATVKLPRNSTQAVNCTFSPASVAFTTADNGYHNTAVASVNVTCSPAPVTYTVGGSVNGLATGTSVTVSDSVNGDSSVVSANGSFTLSAMLGSGAGYNIQATSSSSSQNCGVANGSGSIAANNVTDVLVTCSPTGGAGNTAVYVIDSTNTLFAFDANGVKLAQVTLPAVVNNLNGGGITIDSSNVYVTIGQSITGFAHGAVVAYTRASLAPVTLASGSFSSLATPRGIVYDPHNAQFYVANGGSNVTVYNATGGYLSAITTSVYGPSGIAFDYGNNTIWVANDTNGNGVNATYSVSNFNENGTLAQTIDVTTQFLAPLVPTHVLPYSIAYCAVSAGGPEYVAVGYLQDNPDQDPQGTLGVSEAGVYSTAGALSAAVSPQLGASAQPNAMSCSPSTGNFYIGANDGLHLYSGGGAAISLPSGGFSGLTAPIYGVYAVN